MALSASFLTATVLGTVNIPAKAALRENEPLSENVIDATQLMEELLQASYYDCINEIEDEIKKRGYDHDLSMESVYEQGNPYQSADYTKLIAACCTVMNNSDKSILDIDFLDVTYSEREMEHYVMEKIPRYEKNKDGTYRKAGTYYLTKPQKIWTYKKNKNGAYTRIKKEYHELEKETVKYAKINLSVVDPKEILTRAGLGGQEYLDEYKGRLDIINEEQDIDIDGLCQSVFIKTMDMLDEPDMDAKGSMSDALGTTTGNRQTLLMTAASLLGKVPYEWGGKSEKAGYDEEWWTFGSNGKQKGLDCSGYVQWCFRTAGFQESVWQPLVSTSNILKHCEYIEEKELQPGDLGLLHDGTKGTNHVGIYIGDGYYIHCSSSAGTVTISKPNFQIFMRVPGIDDTEKTIIPIKVEQAAALEGYTEDDIVLLAKLIAHEVRGEGMNAWIAVGEVVVNRVKSSAFPDTVYDVIYQEGYNKAGKLIKQFSYNEEIAGMEYSDAMYNVAKGVLNGSLRILGNENVLFFRNPGDINNNEDWGSFQFFKRIGLTVFYLTDHTAPVSRNEAVKDKKDSNGIPTAYL